MRITLSAAGVDTGVPLFRTEVNENGEWRHESRAVEEVRGQLTPGDLAQFKNFYDEVNWSLEVLNNPVSADDRTLFKLEVDHGHGDVRLYQFSEAMNHLSWQFRDLVHFLRHNVAVGGDLPGRIPPEIAHQPPGVPEQPYAH